MNVLGTRIFEKAMIVFSPEANSYFESQRYTEELQAKFPRNTLVTILEGKGQPGIHNDPKTKEAVVLYGKDIINKGHVSFSSSLFTHSLKDKFNHIKYTPGEMIDIVCDQLGNFERRYYASKDPEKTGTKKYTGKGPNAFDDFSIALMLIFYGIHRFKTDDIYRMYRNQ